MRYEMKQKGILENCIFHIGEALRGGDMPEAGELCRNAEFEFYQNEYEKLHKYRIPRPLIAENGFYLCPRCKKKLISKEVFEEKGMKADYCGNCGQRIFVHRISEAASRYLKTRG